MLFLALIYIAFISLGLPDSLLGSMWPMMNKEFLVPVGNAGFVSMVISCGTIISSLFSSKFISRFGTGILTVISVAMTAGALLGFSIAPSFVWLIIFAVPLGLGAGAVDAGLNEFVAEHYAAKHMNWLHCFWGVGAMLGPLLMTFVASQGGAWRDGYLIISIIQVALVVMLIFSLPKWKKFHQRSLEKRIHMTDKQRKQGLLAPFRKKGTIIRLPAFFLNVAIESTFMLWGASYLVNAKGLAAESAAGFVSLFFLGMTIGRMVSGFISMKLSNDKLIAVGVTGIILGLIVMMLPLSPIFSVIAFVIVGLGIAPIYPSLLHQTPEYFGKEGAQSAMGVQMACAYIGTTLMPPLFGQVFQRTSFIFMPYILFVCTILLFGITTYSAWSFHKRQKTENAQK